MTLAENARTWSARIPFLAMSQVNDQHREAFEAAWRSVLHHGHYVGGPEVGRFEFEFAEYCEARHAIGVANGTDALELILVGSGIGHGDEVLVPANTFVATAEAVCASGAHPVFVDVLPDTLLMDPDAAEAAVTSRTAAVVAVHLFGQMAEVDRLLAVAARHGIALVEDAAQAHGARFGGRRAGGVGHATAFSFYPGKNLGALGDGGAVVTDDAALAARVRALADHGRSPTDRQLHRVRGRNSRLDSIQAAVLSVKLASLDDDNARRRSAMQRYCERLPAHVRPLARHPLAEPVHHLGVVQVDDRAAAIASLDVAEIGWGIHYPIPCHRQPAFTEFDIGPLPVAEHAASRILSLPLSPSLTDDQVGRVCAVLAECGDRT